MAMYHILEESVSQIVLEKIIAGLNLLELLLFSHSPTVTETIALITVRGTLSPMSEAALQHKTKLYNLALPELY